MDKATRTEIEAAAFRGLVEHLQKRTDVQNIDLMILAGFCRNCLSKWYKKGAVEQGIDMDLETAKEVIYGMPYSVWKSMYQEEATEAQKAAFDAADKAVI